VGRWLLREIDYRVYGLCILAIALLFVVWRRWRYKSWPSEGDYLKVGLSLLGIASGVPVCAVFLLTKPPAIEMLSGFSLAAIGVLVPIITFAYGLPRLSALVFPKEAPPQPPANLKVETGGSPRASLETGPRRKRPRRG
jgi:hypothetical protein